jgi:hypothetical protein
MWANIHFSHHYLSWGHGEEQIYYSSEKELCIEHEAINAWLDVLSNSHKIYSGFNSIHIYIYVILVVS